MDEEMLHDLPEEYAALGDRRAVMLEVADKLKELHAAATRLGDAIVRGGLPGRDWRSDDAVLGLLARRLRDMTVDDFITQLAEFAAGHGPEWLRGGRGDLDAFHEEVAALDGVARRLRRVSRRLREDPGGAGRNRRAARLARVFGDGQVADALGHVTALLGDFKALGPFMGPLAPEEWDGAADGWADAGPARLFGAAASGTVRRTLPLPPSQPPKRLRDFAAPKHARLMPWQWIALLYRALWGGIRAFVAQPRGRQVIAVGVVLVLGTLVAVLVARQPHAAQPLTPMGTAAAQASETAAAASATATPPSPTPTRRPAPRLALTCTLQDFTARLTIKNIGATAVSWQANPPANLRVTPQQGRVDAGQSATATVASNNPRKPISGTIAVTATSGSASATSDVSCH
jgi:hypothetical protein